MCENWEVLTSVSKSRIIKQFPKRGLQGILKLVVSKVPRWVLTHYTLSTVTLLSLFKTIQAYHPTISRERGENLWWRRPRHCKHYAHTLCYTTHSPIHNTTLRSHSFMNAVLCMRSPMTPCTVQNTNCITNYSGRYQMQIAQHYIDSQWMV